MIPLDMCKPKLSLTNRNRTSEDSFVRLSVRTVSYNTSTEMTGTKSLLTDYGGNRSR